MVLLLLEPTEPSQGGSGKHSESHAKDANGPLRSPADRPALATSRKKPLRTRLARNYVGNSSAWVRWGWARGHVQDKYVNVFVYG